MTTIQEYDYRGYSITIKCSEKGTFHGYSLSFSTWNPEDSFIGGYDTIDECKTEIETVLNEFIETFPKNFEELADKITKTLVWSGYEDCEADPQIIENLVTNFIKINKL